MIVLYALLIAYIFAINFYAFLLVKGLRDKERNAEQRERAKAMVLPKESGEGGNVQAATPAPPPSTERTNGKLYIAGLLGGAITIYVCMFLLKYKRTDLLLMLLMPLFGVLNIYLFVLLFRSGFSFFVVR